MNFFKSLKITWLSPEKVRKISFGEVTNHGMLDVRTLKPKLGGLFDPRIFGTSTSWECYCGKYKGRKNVGLKCERCEVVITDKNIQRWRPGHIELIVPVTNILLFKNLSVLISRLLEISSSDLEEIIYFNSYVVVDNGQSKIIKKKKIFKKEINLELVRDLMEEFAKNVDDEKLRTKAQKMIKTLPSSDSENIFFWEDYLPFLEKNWNVKIKTGSEAFLSLLKEIDLQKEIEKISLLDKKISYRTKLLKFCSNLQKKNIKLEWIVMQNILVLPAGLRPVTKLKKEDTASGKETIATTQINTLYRKILLANENVRYFTLSEEKDYFGELIINNSKKRLQKAVDQLLQGTTQKNGDIKGILQQISGKEGILRYYSLGKRTDFSGRAVISTDANIRFNEIKIPIQMAIVTLRPLVIRSLLSKKIVFTIHEAEELINKELNNPDVKGIVFQEMNEICSKHIMIFNRAPSLHRLSMQASYPKLTLSKTIGIHPLVTTPCNADFDGDMLLTLDLFTDEEIQEARDHMLTTKQIIDPKNSRVITIPKQDIILGIYYLTREKKPSEMKVFDELSIIFQEYEKGIIDLCDIFVVPFSLFSKNRENNKLIITTLGKIIFNESLPKTFPFFINEIDKYNQLVDDCQPSLFEIEEINEVWKNYSLRTGWEKNSLIKFVDIVVKKMTIEESADFLDELKRIGFKYASCSGISISPFEVGEVISPKEKEKIVQKFEKEEKQIKEYYDRGFYSIREWKEKKTSLWLSCKDEIKEVVLQNFVQKKNSSFYYIWESGARISSENLSQLFAMRGNVRDCEGNLIETPIISSLWEGLNPFEMMILTYGMVKGLVDKALRTADSGYLTRRLVEAAQEAIIVSQDCKSNLPLLISEENFDIFSYRILSRVLAEKVEKEDGKVLLEEGVLIGEKEIKTLKDNNIKQVKVFSPLSCSLINGMCQRCYGGDLSKRNSLVDIGTAVGIIAAQSLGEPGTQLTLRTFHTGGIAEGEDIVQQGLPKIQQVLDNIKPKIKSVLAKETGTISEIGNDFIKQINEKNEEILYRIGSKKALVVQGQKVFPGDRLTVGTVDINEFLNLTNVRECQNFIIKKVKEVYEDQGIEVHEKHIEIFALFMLSRVQITDKKGSDYLEDDIVNYQEILKVNRELISQGKEEIEYINLVTGIKELASSSTSFLASAAFQSPLKSLVNYSINSPVDNFYNPKSRLMVSQLPPVGDGFLEIEKLKEISIKNKKL